jgi:hypothetical protein
MIKMVLHGKDPGTPPCVVLGMTQANLDIMAKGRPAFVDLEELGLPPGTVMLMTGRDHGDLLSVLRAQGLDVPDIDEPAAGHMIRMDISVSAPPDAPSA